MTVDRETLAAAVHDTLHSGEVCRFGHVPPVCRKLTYGCRVADALLAGPLAPAGRPEGGHVLALSDYEMVNLRDALGYIADHEPFPAATLDTGDWLRQVFQRLDRMPSDYAPNPVLPPAAPPAVGGDAAADDDDWQGSTLAAEVLAETRPDPAAVGGGAEPGGGAWDTARRALHRARGHEWSGLGWDSCSCGADAAAVVAAIAPAAAPGGEGLDREAAIETLHRHAHGGEPCAADGPCRAFAMAKAKIDDVWPALAIGLTGGGRDG